MDNETHDGMEGVGIVGVTGGTAVAFFLTLLFL